MFVRWEAAEPWFIAFYHLAHPHSINALRLKEEIHVTNKTAWYMLHKNRHAMCEEDASILLSGFVQVHDACYGLKHNSVYERQPKEKLLLLAAFLKSTIMTTNSLQEVLISSDSMG